MQEWIMSPESYKWVYVLDAAHAAAANTFSLSVILSVSIHQSLMMNVNTADNVLRIVVLIRSTMMTKRNKRPYG